MRTAEDDGRRDFDFLFGSWRVHNRRLTRRLEASSDWQEFETSLETHPVLDGLGNVDRFSSPALPDGTPWEALTLRLFDPEARSWSIWWAATSRPGQLDPPVRGLGHDTVTRAQRLSDRNPRATDAHARLLTAIAAAPRREP